MNESFYAGIANELAAKFRRVSSFTSHGPSIGTYHEEALKSVLRIMLPDRYSLRTGFVFHPELGPSQQGDILIVDEMHPAAYFFREGNFAVVAQPAVACVIEVKSRLTKSTFIEAIQSLASYQRVTTKPYHPPTFLFAYESVGFTPRVLHGWYSSISLPDELHYYPWGIYALNRGLISLQLTGATSWGHHVVIGESRGTGPKLKALSLFLQTIRKTVLIHGRHEQNPFELALLDGLRFGEPHFKFSSGAILNAG